MIASTDGERAAPAIIRDDQPRAFMRHIRELGYCARGARAFCARHGWDWSSFLVNGIPCEQLEATHDALALQLATHAREVG